MRARVLFLLAALFVCLHAYGAPSVVFDATSAIVTVPAGHRVAWVRQYDGGSARGIAADTDSDGTIVIAANVSQAAVWLVADIDNGEWAYAKPANGYPLDEAPLPPASILRGTNGAFSQLVFPTRWGSTLLWIRPGVGAWVPPQVSLPDEDSSIRNELVFHTATNLIPLGSSPSVPAGFQAGDRLLTISLPNPDYAGIVDPFLSAPPSGGVISFLALNSIQMTEGEKQKVDLLRVGGTDGPVTVRCRSVPPAERPATPNLDYVPIDQVVTFAPGQMFQTVELTSIDDALWGGGWKLVALSLTEPAGATLGTVTSYTATIVENDPAPRFSFVDLPESIMERDAPWAFPVTIGLSGAFRDPLTATFSVQGAVAPTIVLTFQPGESRKEVSVPIAADDLPGADRSVYLNLENALNYLNPRLLIVDDDVPTLRPAEANAVEHTQIVQVPMTLDMAPVKSASFQWTTAGGTAIAGQDFVAQSGTMYPNTTGSYLTIAIIEDAIAEGPETFYIDITGLTNVEATQTRFAVTITDDDTPAPAVTIVPASIVEGNTGTKQVEVRVQLATAVPSSAIVLQVATTTAGTARPGDGRFTIGDFRELSQTVTFAPGEREKIFSLTIDGDTTDEDDETIQVTAREKGELRATANVTIVDDDTTSFSGVQDITVEEETGSSAFAVFRVTLSPAPAAQATIDYTTQDVTALAGTDYVAKTGTLTFAPGQAAAEVRVEVLGDTSIEPAETFALQLSNPVGTYLQGNRAIATIHDDDSPAPPVSVAPVSVIEGDAGLTQAALRVKLAHSVTHTVRFTIASTGSGTATSADYQPLSAPVTFAPGQTEVTVNANILGDTIDEDDETFAVEVRQGSTVRATANVTIVDDDTPLSISVADVTVQEKTGPSSQAVFRITVAPAPVTLVSVSFTTADGTAVAGADYLPFSGTVLFFPGQAHQDLSVEVFGDSADEPNETLTLRLSNAIGASIIDDRATATIIDDDDSIPAAVSIAPVSITEGNSGQKHVDLHVRLAAALPAPLTLTVQSDGSGSATPSQDYLPLSRTITFAPGQTDLVVQATILGDLADEDHENFVVRATEGAALRATGMVTILDDDAAAVFSVADVTVTEKTGTSAFAVFRVTLSPPPAANASVAYATQNGTATAGADYLAASGTLVFTAGQASREVSVEVFGDAITEAAETLVLRLSNPIGGDLPIATATATINDDDVAIAPAVSVADVEVREGDSAWDATFTLTLSTAMTVPVKVSFGTVEHTAAPRTDYEEKSGSVTFAPGELTRTVTVRILGDRMPEGREMFRFELRSSEGAPIGDGSALCTIVDDDSVSKRRAARH